MSRGSTAPRPSTPTRWTPADAAPRPAPGLELGRHPLQGDDAARCALRGLHAQRRRLLQPPPARGGHRRRGQERSHPMTETRSQIPDFESALRHVLEEHLEPGDWDARSWSYLDRDGAELVRGEGTLPEPD